ncbi:MAG: GNAT family N-acetyltransferase [Solirubrobacteraceae bacterium]|nr:GNAT family N-acetyltransferase [Solirubrobacteraceae bacterium]
MVGEGDLADLLPLMRGYCTFYETAPTDEALHGLMRACLADPATTGEQLIARDADGEPAGFATIYWMWSSTQAIPIALMNDLFVAPHARSGGIGRALIDACAARAQARGVTVLEWQTAPDNHRAQRVYDATPAEQSTWLTYDWALPSSTTLPDQ